MNQPTEQPADSAAASAHQPPSEFASALLRPITLRLICGVTGTLYTIFAGYIAICIGVAIVIPLFARVYENPPTTLVDYAMLYGPGILFLIVGLPLCFVAASMLFCLITRLLVNRVASRCIFKSTIAYYVMPRRVRLTLFRKPPAAAVAG